MELVEELVDGAFFDVFQREADAPGDEHDWGVESAVGRLNDVVAVLEVFRRDRRECCQTRLALRSSGEYQIATAPCSMA